MSRYKPSRGGGKNLKEVIQLVEEQCPEGRVINISRPYSEPFYEKKQITDDKPKGLWYGIGSSWLDWISSEMPEWFSPFTYEIYVDESKLLRVTNPSEMLVFNEKYSKAERYGNKIDWSAVERDGFGGVEISPYMWEFRLNTITRWYYGWDCASGCIWNYSLIEGVRLIAGEEG